MSKPRVLIVDDQEMFREALASELEFLGFDTVQAEDGFEALEKCQKGNPFDLIFSDMRMPRCDGKKFLIEFRKTSPTTPPFVIMTGFADMKASEAYALGADAFLGKPINAERLEEVTTRFQLPLEKRWEIPKTSEKIVILKRNFEDWDRAEREQFFKLGRLGFAVADANELELISIKEKVAFEFEFATGPFSTLSGQGEVKWLTRSDEDNRAQSAGIEIEYLTPQCRTELITFITKNQLFEAIPEI